MTAAVREDVLGGLDEIEEVLGPLADVMRASNLTIAHTGGKFPFLRANASGLYAPGERTVTTGMADEAGQPIASLAHELGHFIDIQAGSKLGKKKQVRARGSGTLYDSSSLADVSPGSLVSEAQRRMNATETVRTLLREKLGNATDDAGRARIQRAKVVLGPYWHEPREIIARLTEQYVAYRRNAGGWSHETPVYYESSPGWWKREDFEAMVPTLEEALAERLEALGGEAAAARFKAKVAAWGALAPNADGGGHAFEHGGKRYEVRRGQFQLNRDKWAAVDANGTIAGPWGATADEAEAGFRKMQEAAAAERDHAAASPAAASVPLPAGVELHGRFVRGETGPRRGEMSFRKAEVDEVRDLLSRRIAIEKDLVFLEEDDLPPLENRTDNEGMMMKAWLVTLRAEMLSELEALDGEILKARDGPGSRGGRFYITSTGHVHYGLQPTPRMLNDRGLAAGATGGPPDTRGKQQAGFDAARELPAVAVSVPEEWKGLEIEPLRERVRALLSKWAVDKKTFDHPVLGPIGFNNDSASKPTSRAGGGADRRKLLMVADFEKLLPATSYWRSEPASDPIRDRHTTGYHYLIANVLLNGETWPTTFTIRELNNGQLYYNHRVEWPEKRAEPDGDSSVADQPGEAESGKPTGGGLAPTKKIGPLIIKSNPEGKGGPLAFSTETPVTDPSVGGSPFRESRMLLGGRNGKSPLGYPGLYPHDGDRNAPAFSGLSPGLILDPGTMVLKSRRLHGRRWVDGVQVSIENRRGSVRHWKDAESGEEGRTKVKTPYGYARRTLSTDGEHHDVFLGPLAHSDRIDGTDVYVVTTMRPPEFTEVDEQKAMVGFESLEAARAAFLEHYDNPRFIGQIDVLPWQEWKTEVRSTFHGGGLVRGEVVHRRGDPVRFGHIGPDGLMVVKAKVPPPRAQPGASPGAGNGKSAPTGPPAKLPTSPAAAAALMAPKEAEPPPTAGEAVDHHELGTYLDGFRASLAKVITTLTGLFPGVPVAGRLRETASLAAKLVEKQKGLGDIEDVGGARIELENCPDILAAVGRVQRSMKVTREEDYINTPKSGLYRGCHLFVAEPGGKPIEIQFRTARQTALAEAIHDLTFKSQGGAPPEAMPYFKQVADYFAVRDEAPGAASATGEDQKPASTDQESQIDNRDTESAQMPECPPTVKQMGGCVNEPSDAMLKVAVDGGDDVGGLKEVLAIRDHDNRRTIALRALGPDIDRAKLFAEARKRYAPPRFEVAIGMARNVATFTRLYPRFADGLENGSTGEQQPESKKLGKSEKPKGEEAHGATG
jgi:ppGpp synthetase/RelA/SpoT-type nucleotidyltranferase